jgi:hypothetical protein
MKTASEWAIKTSQAVSADASSSLYEKFRNRYLDHVWNCRLCQPNRFGSDRNGRLVILNHWTVTKLCDQAELWLERIQSCFNEAWQK